MAVERKICYKSLSALTSGFILAKPTMRLTKDLRLLLCCAIMQR